MGREQSDTKVSQDLYTHKARYTIENQQCEHHTQHGTAHYIAQIVHTEIYARKAHKQGVRKARHHKHRRLITVIQAYLTAAKALAA